MEPEQVLDLIRSAPERYDTVRASLRYRADGLKRKEIGERVLRTEAGRRAFQTCSQEASEAVSRPADYPWLDGPYGWRSRVWHVDRCHWRLETGMPGGGVDISACNGRRRLPIGGPPGSGLVRDRRVGAGPREDDWELLLPLFTWPEQEAYEELRPTVLFGGSVSGRARETGTPERTMYRRVERFEEGGMLSLFATDPAAARAKRQSLEPAVRRMIVELKAEHPKLNPNEISNIVYVRTGRRLGKHTPARVLAEEVVPLKLSRLFEPYHETEEVGEARRAVVALHLDGWSVKAIASYMRVSRSTVYRVLGRWIEEDDAGLEDRPPGRPKGVRKMDLATMDFIRRSQENPELGAFRIHAALEQKRGADVSVRTVGRVMAVHRDLYGLAKPKRSPGGKAEMLFRAKKRHEIWTADVRYATAKRALGAPSSPRVPPESWTR